MYTHISMYMYLCICMIYMYIYIYIYTCQSGDPGAPREGQGGPEDLGATNIYTRNHKLLLLIVA